MQLSIRAKRHTRQLGRRGENAAAALLAAEGLTVLARNYRCHVGELDIVALDGSELVFVEVKSIRKKAGFTPGGNLSMHQRRRNRNAAKVYLKVIGYPPLKCRFDLIEAVYSRGFLVSLRRTEDYLPPLLPERSSSDR